MRPKLRMTYQARQTEYLTIDMSRVVSIEPKGSTMKVEFTFGDYGDTTSRYCERLETLDENQIQ